MGRNLASSTALSGGNGNTLLPGQLPAFGTGRYRIFFVTENWTPPAGVTKVRARVHGGGGGITADAGSSSFGSLMSATGGKRGVGAVAGVGGVGVGGDFQASGGAGGAGAGGGGGAAGSELGDGGTGGVADATGNAGGGGAVGGKVGGNGGAAGPGAGASPVMAGPSNTNGLQYAPNIRGMAASAANTTLEPFNLPFPGFAFVGGGGVWGSNWLPARMAGTDGGGGCGGGISNTSAPQGGGHGGVFGGGGGGNMSAASGMEGGQGGRLSDERAIGGGFGGTKGRAGSGGGGYARGVFDNLAAGQPIPITVATANPVTGVAAGLVILEF